MRYRACFLVLGMFFAACAPRINSQEGDDKGTIMQPAQGPRWTGSAGEENPDYTGQDAGGPATDMRTPADLTPPAADMAPAPGWYPPGHDCTADALCASGYCIGVGEPFPGVCTALLCTVAADCPKYGGMNRPCVDNPYADKGTKPRFCLP